MIIESNAGQVPATKDQGSWIDVRRIIEDVNAERRKNPRIELHCLVRIEGFPGEYIITDISQGGVFIECEDGLTDRFWAGQTLSLLMKLPIWDEPVTAEVEVASVRQRGMGCEFIELDKRGQEAIESCVDGFKDTLIIKSNSYMAEEQRCSLETRKVYVKPDGSALLVCPYCGSQRTVNVAEMSGTKIPVRVNCDCLSSFWASFEFRNTYRKQVSLLGSYTRLPVRAHWYRMTVKDISLKGIQFTTPAMHELKEGDEGTLEFTLDDPNRSRIKRNAVVMWTKDKNVGCTFKNSDLYAYDKDLGFYLMP